MGKLGKSKKIIAAVIVFMAALFCLYSQSQQQTSNTNVEETIVFSDDYFSDSADSNLNQEFKSSSTIGVFIRMIVMLIIVIALIYGVLWFIKRKTNIVKTEDDYLRRAAYINIAPGKTVEVITLIDKAYLIGVTEDNISLLGEIDDKELIQAMNLSADKKNQTKKPANFTEVLDMFLVKNNKNKNIFADTENKVDNLFNSTKTEE